MSQLIRYSRACGSYHDILDRGMNAANIKLLKQGFLLVKLKSSLRKFSQWPKEKEQKDKQQSTKNYTENKR
jgi:hypothetical protein